jgi:hypothetical protein
MNNRPWNFDEARDHCRKASSHQEAAEANLKEAYVDYAKAQEAYALHLALTVTSLREMSTPATVCLELARGAGDVAALRRTRDIAEGVKAAAEQACWRRNADRKDAQRFADWSQRREMAEAGHDTRPTYEVAA